jgi:hypothetical protein
MVPTYPKRTPLLRSTLLALVLTIGTVAVAVGRDGSSDHAPSSGAGLAISPAVIGAMAAVPTPSGADPGPRYDGLTRPLTPALDRTVARAPEALPAVVRSAGTGSAKDAETASADYRGRNHVWMPSLGINRSISFYSCANQSYPGNRVYRWGCAGSNNVYLFGHASSVFKSLHDAYVRGKLQKGAVLYYADGRGKVHTYKVAWWKLTTATKGTWAYASQSRPSLTLQTCIGAQNQYRLIVRLTEV